MREEEKNREQSEERVTHRGGTKLGARKPAEPKEKKAPPTKAKKQSRGGDPKKRPAPVEKPKKTAPSSPEEKTEQRAKRPAEALPRRERNAARGSEKTAERVRKERPAEPAPENTRLRTDAERGRVLHQVVPYVLFWVALFALVCFVLEMFGKGSAVGAVGRWFSAFLCGLFGITAYLFPFLLIALSLRWKRFAEKNILLKKILLSTMFFLLLSGIVHVFRDRDTARCLVDAAALYAGGMARTGGGLFGGFIGEWLGFCLRLVGTCVLAIPTLLLIGIYLIGLTPSDLWQRIQCKLAWMRGRRSASRSEAEGAPAIGGDGKAPEGEKSQNAEPVWRTPRPLDARGRPTYDFHEEEPEVVAEPAPPKKEPKRVEEKHPSASERRMEAIQALYDSMKEEPPSIGEEEIDEIPEAQKAPAAPETPPPAPEASTIHSYRDPKPRAVPTVDLPKDSDRYYAPFALPVRPEPKRERGEQGGSSRIVITPHEIPDGEAPAMGVSLAGEGAPDRVAAEVNSAPDGVVGAPIAEKMPETVENEPRFAPNFEKREADDSSLIGEDMEAEDDFSAEEQESISDPALSGISRFHVVFEADAEAEADEELPPPEEAPPALTVKEKRERVITIAPKPTVLDAAPLGEVAPPVDPEPRVYCIPPLTLLNEDKGVHGDFYEEMEDKKERLRQTLADFGLRIQERIDCFHGPSITRYEFAPEAGVSVRSIQNRIDDISLSMGAHVRIEGLVMGKRSIGVEVPNKVRETVYMRTVLESEPFVTSQKPLEVPLGLDIGGTVQMCNLAAMPHLLIAGSTGSGKSVCINAILISLLYKTSPDDLRLILIDPKQVEFAPYEHIPHLYMPIITDMQRAAGALSCAVQEMERRFSLFKDIGVRDLDSYNDMVKNDPEREHLPRIIIVIDEFADLKMSCNNNDPETFTCRIAQKARAAGIHLIIGTQRPSVDVITGKLKTNIASRIAFTVKQQVDSRTILDINGAETLTGKGDMLYMPSGFMTPVRVQGPFVSDGEVGRVVSYVRSHNEPVLYNQAFMDQIEVEMAKAAKNDKKTTDDMDYDGLDDNEDPKFVEAVELAVETQKVATSLLQRRLGVGYGRAAKIIDRMEELGLVSAPDGNKARKVLPAAQGYLTHLGVGEDFEDEGDFGLE